jgi:hypothetical protein
MSILRFGDGRDIEIPELLGRQLEAAAVDSVSAAAQIVDDELSPALLLIADGELLLVTRNGTQRWKPSEIRRIEATDIVPVTGDLVTFAAWSVTSERADFLRAVSRLVPGLSTPPARRPAPSAITFTEPPQSALSRIAERYADGAVAALSCVAFVVAAASAPDKSNCDLPAGPLFGPFTWISGLGFLAAAALALVCRKSGGAKFASATGLVLLAGLSTIFLGLSEMNIHEGQGPTRQDALRYTARSAPAGKRVYWLGPKFHDTPANSSVGSVTYSYTHDRVFSTEVEVRTPAANPARSYGKRSTLRVRLANRDTVVLTVNGQTAADRVLLQEARAMIEPIPLDVTASGCNGYA